MPRIAYTLQVRFGPRVEYVQVYDDGSSPGLLPLLDAASEASPGFCPVLIEITSSGEGRAAHR